MAYTGGVEIVEPGFQLFTDMEYQLQEYVIRPWSFAGFECLEGSVYFLGHEIS